MPQLLRRKNQPIPFLGALHPFGWLFRAKYRLRGWKRAAPTASLNHDIARKLDEDPEFKQLSFTFCVIALSARVACAGGAPTRESYAMFRECFPLKGQLCSKIRSLFALACANTTPYAHYVTQIRHMFPHHPSLRLSLIERLFRIAAAQGRIPREKEQLLADIAYLLELSPAQYLELHTRYQRPADAADVLGIASTPEGAALGKRYRELMQRWHPDRFASEQRSPEIDLLLQLKSAEINEAYRALRRQAA